MIDDKDTKALAEEEAKTFYSFGLQSFTELIDELEVWWLIEDKVKALEPSFTPTPRPAKAAPASNEASELAEKMSVLESDTKAIEERINTLQTVNDVMEHECALLKVEIKEKTDRLFKAEEESKKSGEELSTATTKLAMLKVDKEAKKAELAAANIELAALTESRKKGEKELSTATKELMELKEKLAVVEDQMEGKNEHVEAAYDELPMIRA